MISKHLLPLGLILLLLITLFAFRQPCNNSVDLLEAYQIANTEAIKWDASAKPYFITSVDDSVKNYSVKGEDGTRSYWNFDFVVEGTDKHLIITIQNKSIVSRIEAESTVEPNYIISIADLHISTADAVTIARKNYGLLPGIDWAQGYHFVLENDGAALILSVVGLDENGNMKRIYFNAKTGEVIP